jgi:hypothetical protein
MIALLVWARSWGIALGRGRRSPALEGVEERLEAACDIHGRRSAIGGIR